MDLFEYQARDIFEKHGVPVLAAAIATTADEAEKAATAIGGKVVVKAQAGAGRIDTVGIHAKHLIRIQGTRPHGEVIDLADSGLQDVRRRYCKANTPTCEKLFGTSGILGP